MFHKPVSGLAGIAFLVLCASVATAQDFHVDTQIFNLKGAPPGEKPAGMKDAAKKAARPQLMDACETLVHAGKAYDHNRGLNQMTIYEPAHEQFVIVDESRNLATKISFDEITNRLIRDHASGEAFLADAEKRKVPRDRIEFFRFQLKPVFKEKFSTDGGKPELAMTSVLVDYHVECARHEWPAVQTYLEYADWVARLSYVTRRRGMLPGPRLAVNEALRRHRVLPTKVTLETRNTDGIHYRAEHKYVWELNGDNKATILHWERKAEAKTTRYVAWEKFFESTQETANRK
ncbi:MAG: hypothetical protein HY290_20135 [Planctomycetia bacterium]|nr:hypothetical protein [Planctomycetia bacterium]